MPRKKAPWGRTLSYMSYIQKTAGKGRIMTHYGGIWNVIHEQGHHDTPNQFVQRCLCNWRMHWRTLPVLRRLHKPGNALKDSQGHKPTLAEFEAHPEVYLKSLSDTVMREFVSPKWKEQINIIGFPADCDGGWATNAWGIIFKVGAGPHNHPVLLPSRNEDGLCIPYNARALPPYKADNVKTKLRHHLHVHPTSGYLYVYLGTDDKGKAVTESMHRIITLGARGPRPANHEVSHACHNPFCLSPRCMHWKTHRDNMLEEVPVMVWSNSNADAAQQPGNAGQQQGNNAGGD